MNVASSSDDGAPTPTAARTAARQLGPHVSGPGDGNDIREGRIRAQTRALYREAALGLISKGGRIFYALLAAQDTGDEPTRLPDYLLKEAEPEPTSYSPAGSSIHFGVWTGAMEAEFDGLEVAETFAEISEVPSVSNIVESKWLLK